MTDDSNDLILGIQLAAGDQTAAPVNVRLVVALARAGALPVVEFGTDDDVVAAVRAITARTDRPFAVQPRGPIATEGLADPAVLPPTVSTVLLGAATIADLLDDANLEAAIARWSQHRRVLAEITSRSDAVAAVAAGAGGLIVKGCESGGRVGGTETFMLLQQTVDLGVPVWARGGIGLHSAAGAIALGARGVVLDSQLSLVRESDLPAATRAAIAAMDGTETRLIGDHRVYTRPDLPIAARSADEPSAPIAAELGPDLAHDLVPVGQDAASAAGLAHRFKTAGGVVEAVRTSIRSHLAGASRLTPLAPNHGIAETHGIRYPIAQGPMTRVSDQAAFAAAVADQGGLPFLALALLPGTEVEPLLEETARLLGDRPWGVGILGFVPPELREEQLAVVQRVRPPVALIAGGRPSQAAPLEAAGIATYLHVPSPGLLDRFVKEGARRFVFEGRECGGHVGPRASFPLWDAQVERLVAVPDPENLHILFAGGIHDARSAAAAAAIGAPLAARGARLGVLMGTAYLFTAEAVSTGAITRGFQAAAVACDETVLLETSPGHATRCAETDYVRTFVDTKARLEADQVSTKDMWGELETLNLGRLRVASKGLAHGGQGLVEVDEETQRREGMYMIGQVATLRDQLTTIAALHEEVSSAGTDLIRRLADHAVAARAEPDRVPPPFDIAIVGMASMFPGSSTVDEFWTSIVDGVNSITEVPASRWEPDLYFDPEATTVGAGRKTPSKWGGFLSAVGFDPLAYGIPPASLAAIEPVQLLSLEVATRALADAGYADREFDRSRASVIFGAENGNDLSGAYGMRAMLPQLLGDLPPELDQYLPALTEDSFPGVLTNVIAGRIANRLNLGGLNFTVDAACAASLAAVDAACKELISGNSDVVLCGGADVHNGINDFLLFSSVHALSPRGQCRTFDADADGIALGEGVACVVLKRRQDAERDGDRIYSIIEAVAGSSDGRHLGLTAPRKEGQQLALERAYAQARRPTTDLGLVEAHGTGTVVGDKTELATLTEAWADQDAGVGSCVLGSVKSQIGHTKCAAGLAGLIKASSALYRGVLPPTGNLTSPNAAYDRATSPFRFLDHARPWLGDQRHAGVSAFGFGGSNFHAVLSSYPEDDGPAHGVDSWPAELFLFRAAHLDEAVVQLESLASVVDAIVREDPASQRHRLRDLAATTAATGSGPTQIAIVATDFGDLADQLAVARDGQARSDRVFVAGPDRRPNDAAGPRTAFLYPGQGSQRTGMLVDLFNTFPFLRDLLVAGAPWVDALYPGAAFTAEERGAQAAAITDTRVAQPVLGICGMAMTRLLASVAVEPDVTAGHSYGELIALAAAGAFDAETLLRLSAARGEAIVMAASGDGDPGTMAAVSADLETVTAALAVHPEVVVANHNSPSQVVISGATGPLATVVAELASAGVAAKTLKVACAFHSPLVGAAAGQLATGLASVSVDTPRIPVWANSTAARYPSAPDEIRAVLADQVAQSVRFVDQIESMYDAGIRTFVETGPGRVLTQLVGKILGDRPHRAIATDVPGEHGVKRFLMAVAELAVDGADIATEVLFGGRAVALDTGQLPVPAPGWTIDGHLVRTASGGVVVGSLQPADEFPAVSLGGTVGQPEREATVLEYLRGLRELVATEREVMLHYLGAPAEIVASASPAAQLTPASEDGSIANGSGPATNGSNGKSTPGPEAAAPTAGPAPIRGEALLAVVLQLVADRTGYPTDMLDPDLDLEADLSIDSIKRIEIIGELADRIGLDAQDGGIDDSAIEELSQLKSLREIVVWIDALDPEAVSTSPAPETSPEVPASASASDGTGAVEDEAPAVPDLTTRHILKVVEVDLPSADRHRLEGTTVLVADDTRGIGASVAAHLGHWGATVSLIAADHRPTEADLDRLRAADGLIWLRALHPDAGAHPASFDARSAFAWWQPAILGGTTRLITATAGSGSFISDPAVSLPGLGLAGMAKAISREFDDCTVRVVDLDPNADADMLSACILDEFFDADGGPVEVGYDGLQRVTRVVVPEPLEVPADGDGGLRPIGASDPVVLITGGARGITARAAIAIARRGGCHLELAGRSPLPSGDEDPALATALDAVALRRALIATGGFSTPAAIEAECSRILAGREIRATLSLLRKLGGEVHYHQIDVRDADALARLVADIHHRFGRLDLVVHGAGVLDDHLVRDKDAAGFDRVFATKVDAARTLLDVTEPETPLVFFGSVSGVFGNRGQVDYGAANDALDELAEAANHARPGRVVSIDWGPWAGTGMVSPELEREYSRRGVGLIEPDDGAQALLDELAAAPAAPGHVVVMRAQPEALAPEMRRWAPSVEEAVQ
ncbi:MAG TPA: SDR family NAD(P)-dependent oxidoreductase [Acidimicrobiales bacterium]|nr:SDR family NAD(P)-dependent oxidoreductase [Acidimicrobiales bacterium]